MQELEPIQRDRTALVPSHPGEIDWDAQPAALTTREAAALLGKSPGNVRARASKGDFGPTMTGPDGLPRYDRDRVRAVREHMAARQAQMRPTSAAPPPADPPSVALLAALQSQQSDQVALWKFWLEEARDAARYAKEEASELRDMLRDREETTRETLSHMDMLHNQSLMQMKEMLANERVQWQREAAAKNAEIERLKAQLNLEKQSNPVKGRAQLWRK